MGVNTYYKYLNQFGLLSKTGIDLYGEANSIFLKEEKVGPVELATIAFGQRFEITPIQMIKMLATIANMGKSVTPRLVKATINSKTGKRTDLEVKTGEQVISETTAKKVLSMMQSVVSEGTGKKAGVTGYSVGGKTGTSEDGVNTGKYVASFVGVADVNDPEIAIIVILYNPTGEGGHQGGGIAAPIAGQILGEILPYLEIQKTATEETKAVTMPKIENLTITEAKKILKNIGLNFKVNQEEYTGESIIVNQIPKAGIEILQGTTVILDI